MLNFKKKKDLQEKGRLEFLPLEICLETALCSLQSKSINEKSNNTLSDFDEGNNSSELELRVNFNEITLKETEYN